MSITVELSPEEEEQVRAIPDLNERIDLFFVTRWPNRSVEMQAPASARVESRTRRYNKLLDCEPKACRAKRCSVVF
jgi:hypothetical protein